MGRRFDRFIEWMGPGLAVLGLGMVVYSSVGLYRSQREFERKRAEIKIELEKIRNPISEKCDYVSDLPTEREWTDSLKLGGKYGARMREVSLYSWKAVVEPRVVKVQEGDDFIHRQNDELVYALLEANSRDLLIGCENLRRINEEMMEDFREVSEGLSRIMETFDSGAEDFKVAAGFSVMKKDPSSWAEKMRSALEALIKYEIMPKHDRIEAYLREKASESEQDALQFEVFELASPLSSGYYSPRRFYGELVQLLDQTSRIEHPDEKQKAVRRLVNLGVGYARHRLPPKECQVPLFLEFSELGYKPEELREMVILK